MKVRFEDTMGSINLHRGWHVNDFEESHKFIAGPFPFPNVENAEFFLFLEILDMPALCGSDNDGNPRWVVELSAVCPALVPAKEKASALSSCSWEGMDENDPRVMAEVFSNYGTSAHIDSSSCSSLRTGVRRAIRLANEAANDLTCYLDQPQNKLGTTFLESLSGDLLAPLRRVPESPEAALVHKMYSNSGPFLLGGDVNPLYQPKTLRDVQTMQGGGLMVQQSIFTACPFCILMLEHYRPDGSCRCNDAEHAEMAEWGYVWDSESARWVAGPEED